MWKFHPNWFYGSICYDCNLSRCLREINYSHEHSVSRYSKSAGEVSIDGLHNCWHSVANKLSLRLSATLTEDASSVASIGCALPSLTTGVGSCELDIPSTWFQADKFVDTKVQLLFRCGIEDSSSSSQACGQACRNCHMPRFPRLVVFSLRCRSPLASRTNSQFSYCKYGRFPAWRMEWQFEVQYHGS